MKLKYRQFSIFVMLSYMLLECSPGSEKDVINQINSLAGVVEVNDIFGKYDIIVKVAAENPDLMESTIFQIRQIKIISKNTFPR